jgi:hypothetical protein
MGLDGGTFTIVPESGAGRHRAGGAGSGTVGAGSGTVGAGPGTVGAGSGTAGAGSGTVGAGAQQGRPATSH